MDELKSWGRVLLPRGGPARNAVFALGPFGGN